MVEERKSREMALLSLSLSLCFSVSLSQILSKQLNPSFKREQGKK